MTPPRIFALTAIMALLAAACGSSGENTSTVSTVKPGGGEPAELTAGVVPALGEVGDITLEDDSFPKPLISRDDLQSGGPPPDGIPPIDEPVFVSVNDVDFLQSQEPVISLVVGNDTRAYPLQIMTWHEIVNDTVDGKPVTVTFCPLCNSAFVFDRTIDGEVNSFGTSGLLYLSSLVMYDRQTRSLWSHFSGEGLAGVYAGHQLETLPTSIISWADFSEANPDGLVLSRDTGEDRPYGENPYPGYDDVDVPPFLFDGEVDGRAAAKQRVVGVRDDGESVAISLDLLAEETEVEFELGAKSYVAEWKPGTASALEAEDVAGGRDVGSVRVFFIDGDARTPVVHVDTFWFAWAAFQPETRLIE